MAIADTILCHSLGRIRDTYVRLDLGGILAVASQETADWIAAAMAGKPVKVGEKIAVAKEGTSQPRPSWRKRTFT